MMKIFCVPKIAQKYSKLMSFKCKHQENTLFYFDCYSEGNASIKKRSTYKPCLGHILIGHTKWYTPKCVIWVCQPDKHAVSNPVFKATRIIYKLDIK